MLNIRLVVEIAHRMSVLPITPLRFVQICLAWPLSSGLLISPDVSGDELPAEIYMADFHQSAWSFSGSSALCELSHEIPRFGVARFQRLAGDELSFRIDSYQPVPERLEGVLREASPSWNHGASDKLEQMIEVQTGLQPIKLDRRPAGWLLSALAKGQIGSFDMLDWNDSRKLRQIRLSPVNFQQPYRAFKRCLRELSLKGFRDLQSSTVHFALDVDRLDEAGEASLKGLADYIKADSRITAVRVTGHADDQGTRRYNLRLSARRAKRICDYLEQQGVARKLLSPRHYGESRPKIRGRSERARTANRRAEIELVR
jgi:outer membrane protein OmpA-like peptidoglycan-associated protein